MLFFFVDIVVVVNVIVVAMLVFTGNIIFSCWSEAPEDYHWVSVCHGGGVVYFLTDPTTVLRLCCVLLLLRLWYRVNLSNAAPWLIFEYKELEQI